MLMRYDPEPASHLLFWLFAVSRVIVASTMLNAALALERRPSQEEVLHA